MLSFPTRPIGKRCAEFSNAIHRERCVEFSLFLGGGGKVRKNFLYQKNILFASKKTHSCRNTSKIYLFESSDFQILFTCRCFSMDRLTDRVL
ncbi:hypothetical protein Lepto1548_17000 [Leptospira interrogans serovar Bataviae]|nr:hypothetical protein Lepto1548_17000 [Leptospira interrogans serovar Bataviae]